MTIDWQKEVEARKEELLEDLKNLLRVNSERDDSKVTPDAPFGPGPRDALKHMLAYGERDGFVVKNVDNYAGHIDLGEGDETLGIFGHMDVVPAGDGWDTDPYEPVIKDGKIFARGSSDDKGPSMAAYYAMKIIKDLDLELSKKVRFVVGSDEESGWADMAYYFEHEEEPDFGFSPDAEFPIINGEKGNVSFALRFQGDNAGDYVLKTFTSGLRENMVPGTATATLEVPSAEAAIQMEEAFYRFVEANPVSGSIEADNTSCFCYRQASNAANLSNHAWGRAIDLNPLENPYVYVTPNGSYSEHSASAPYVTNRDPSIPHVITTSDTAYRILTAYGFTWGGHFSPDKDYQHFDYRG